MDSPDFFLLSPQKILIYKTNNIHLLFSLTFYAQSLSLVVALELNYFFRKKI